MRLRRELEPGPQGIGAAKPPVLHTLPPLKKKKKWKISKISENVFWSGCVLIIPRSPLRNVRFPVLLEAIHLESHLRDLLVYCTIPLENTMEEFPIVTKTVNRSLVFELQCVRITSPEAFETNPIKVFSRAQYQHTTNFDPQSIHNPNLSFQLSLSAKERSVWSLVRLLWHTARMDFCLCLRIFTPLFGGVRGRGPT